MIPNRENGAKVARFFTKQSGKRINVVTPIKLLVRVVAMLNVDSKSRIESANIIEKDKFPAKQSAADEKATIQDVFVPRVLSHASAYEVAPVILHTRAISIKVYAEIPPVIMVSNVAGMRAVGAFPNAATP